MRYTIRIVLTILMLCCSLFAIRQAFNGVDAGAFSFFQYLPFTLLLVLTVVILFLDWKGYQIQNNTFQLFPSFLGILLSSLVIFKYIQYQAINNAKTVLEITNLPGAGNVLSFDFKEKGHFRLQEYDLLGNTSYYRNYIKMQDTLQIVESNYAGYAKKLPKLGFIKNDSVYWFDFDTMLVRKNNVIQH